MSSTRNAVAALGLALVIGGGCATSVEERDSGGGIDMDELGQASAEAFCARVFGCCEPGELGKPFGDDLASCEAELGSEYEDLFEELEASITAGRLVYHSDLASDCLDAIDELACFDLFNEPSVDACRLIFQGLVPTGGTCTTYMDCAAGFCDGLAESPSGTGTCAAPSFDESTPNPEPSTTCDGL